MIRVKSDYMIRLFNTILRLATLAAKLALTLYIGRYLSLADLGLYGLVSGAVIILTVVIGIRFDFVVSRDLVGATPLEALYKMRDQGIFYAFNHLILALIAFLIFITGITEIGGRILFIIFVLSVTESYAGMIYTNMNSLGRPLLANTLFFIRAGLWGLLVIVLGFFAKASRTSDVIFAFWIAGVSASLIFALLTWRHLPWRKAMKTPVNWAWIKKGVSRSFFIWLGSLGIAMGFCIDRFVVAHNLGLDLAGVATFYSSFAAAIFTLIQSGVLFFSYPRLIALHRKKDRQGFWQEARKAVWHVAFSAGAGVVAVGLIVPLLGRFLHRPILTDAAITLWLMLFGIWLRCNAETLYYILFARHQDRAIWLGDLLFLLPAFGGNALLVPLIGFKGIGYSAVLSATFILAWRFWHIKYGREALLPHEPIPSAMPDFEET